MSLDDLLCSVDHAVLRELDFLYQDIHQLRCQTLTA